MKLPLPTLHRTFRFEITVTEGDKTFTLPLGTGTHNFTVHWGDSFSDKITSATDPDRVHTYSTAGTYIISMRGTCTNFAFDNVGDKLKLKKLLGFIDMGFTILNFYGCSNLTRVHPSMRILRSLTTASHTFNVCSSLISIPAGIFNGAVNITSFEATFYNCSSLTSIPTGLFDNNTVVTNFNAVFYGCSSLTSIPTDLFRYNTAVINFSGCFNRCSSLTSIPTDLFRYNTAVTRFDWYFYNCSSLTSIPTGLFDNNTLVTTFRYTFYGCSNIDQVLDGNIFLYNDKIDDFRHTFAGCSKLTGLGWQTIILNAEAQETPPTYTDDCFFGAVALTNYEEIPEVWK